jgi:hypothetical protein
MVEESESKEFDEIQLFFATAPVTDRGRSFYPVTTEEELINEAEGAGVEEEVVPLQPALDMEKGFQKTEHVVDLVAIDTGSIQIGSTENGVVIAVKGAVISQQDDKYSLHRMGPKLIHISRENQIAVLEGIGQGLGRQDMFVKTSKDGEKTISGGSVGFKQVQDRIRNYVERKLQRFAISTIKGGIILFDGALSAREWDTPTKFLEDTRESAFNEGNSLVGIAKRSDLEVDGVNILYLLTGTQEPCYREIRDPDWSALYPPSFGTIFVVRFGPGGFTFRTDVCPFIAPAKEILNRLYQNARICLGYPYLLKLAHIHSVFTKPEVVQLQVLAAKDYGLRMQKPQDISIIFAPFRRGV